MNFPISDNEGRKTQKKHTRQNIERNSMKKEKYSNTIYSSGQKEKGREKKRE